tara:strand:- start:34 stop:498 length:465 start_codon:yes stop_codon:yes gene_type:complete
MRNKKENNNNENNESNHPEMNEEHIEVSKNVPNTVEELLERQNKFGIEFIEIDDLDDNDKIKEIISKRQEKIDETVKEILKVLQKNNSGPNEDITLSIILLKRIKGFHEFLLKKIDLKDNIQAEMIEKISRDCSKLEIVLKILEKDIDIDIDQD